MWLSSEHCAAEAAELIGDLSLRDERTLGSHCSLFRSTSREQLAAEFLHQDGLRRLIDINTMIGNTLAYALTGVQSLMGLQMG